MNDGCTRTAGQIPTRGDERQPAGSISASPRLGSPRDCPAAPATGRPGSRTPRAPARTRLSFTAGKSGGSPGGAGRARVTARLKTNKTASKRRTRRGGGGGRGTGRKPQEIKKLTSEQTGGGGGRRPRSPTPPRRVVPVRVRPPPRPQPHLPPARAARGAPSCAR